MAQTIGGRIREIRAQKGLKQSALAKLVGISPTYLNLIEHDKRAVAGKLLSVFASALETDRTLLVRGATAEMIEHLQQSARQVPSTYNAPTAELDEIEIFTTRFPGWASVLSHQAQTQKRLESLIEILSDRLSHDPILSETIHIMLSNITAIRSISELLVMRGSMQEAKQKSFIQNIFQESKRLSVTAEKLLLQFDPAQAGKAEVNEAPTQRASHNLARPKAKTPSDSEALPSLNLPEAIKNAPAFLRAQEVITRQALHESFKAHHNQPFLIADHFGLPASLVFYQLLSLSGQEGLPDYGLLAVDNAGGVLYRHEIGTMRLPSRSGACPRWPIYRAFGATGEPVLQRMSFITGETYQAYAIAQSRKRDFAQLVPVSQSVMLFHEAQTDDPTPFAPPDVAVGFHCSVCNRTDCTDRREAYALFAD